MCTPACGWAGGGFPGSPPLQSTPLAHPQLQAPAMGGHGEGAQHTEPPHLFKPSRAGGKFSFVVGSSLFPQHCKQTVCL